MGWSGGGGGMFGGGGHPGSSSSTGLPFGGIPSELQSGVDRLLKTEPEHGEPTVSFTQQPTPEESLRLTLWRLLTRYPRLLFASAALIVLMSVTMQAGPWLTEKAIDHGMVPGHRHLSVVIAAAPTWRSPSRPPWLSAHR
jgi:ATP-binding cassette subfamily B protein